MKQASPKSEHDRQMIEAVVRRFGPIPRARVHELTGIRLSATSTLVRELLIAGRLIEDGVEESSVGRKGALLRLNETWRSAVGIEFDDESVTVGVTNLHPEIRHTLSRPTALDGGADGLIAQLIDTTRQALSESDTDPDSLLALGIADPGLVDSQRGITLTSSTIPFWKNIPLREIFEREFGIPVLVETRTRAKAVAEHEADGPNTPASMVYIDYGSGIGAGFYVDGRLLYGHGSAAGEFGHTHIGEDGPVCSCGSFGCLEAIAGLRAVEVRARGILEAGGKTDLLEMAGGDPARITGWMVFEAASRGDKVSANVVAEVARNLGLGIANLVNLFNPALVVLDARLRLAGPELPEQITSIVRRQALRESSDQVSIRYAAITEAAGVLGVVQMALSKHYEVPVFRMPPFLAEGGL